MNIKEVKIKLTFLEPILGTAPKNKEVYSSYVQTKQVEKASKTGIEVAQEMLDEELSTLPENENGLEEKGWTTFHAIDGKPFIYDYLMTGFFKAACSVLRKDKSTQSAKVTAFNKVIDGMVFPSPRHLFLNIPEGEEMGVLERPLRAQTPQGERIALAKSDTCPAGTTIEVTLTIIGTTVTDKLLDEWLSYGKFRGLGQWRNAGFGKFSYEYLVE
jgi:hypothetical protein